MLLYSESSDVPAPRERTVSVIATDHLVKRFGAIQALAGVTLTVERGQIFGLLGQNGAGKTTLIKILLGIIKTTEGQRPAARPAGRHGVGASARSATCPRTTASPTTTPAPACSTSTAPCSACRAASAGKRIPRGAGSGRPQGADALQDPHLLQGHEAAARHRPGPDARPGRDLPRRADRRRRSGRPARDPRNAGSPQERGQNDLPQLAPAGRGGADLRPRGHPATGRDDPRGRHRHADQAAGVVPGRPGRRRDVPGGGSRPSSATRCGPLGGFWEVGADRRADHRPARGAAARARPPAAAPRQKRQTLEDLFVQTVTSAEPGVDHRAVRPPRREAAGEPDVRIQAH